ncbi:MAG: hypothetical protein ACYCWW_14565 [Deltaproteobacteria bacterium]
MTLRNALIAAAAAALGLAGCPPNETGALCQVSSTCPPGQSCQGGVCELGDAGSGGLDGGDGGTSGGGADAGAPRLAGQVVLNGGAVPPNSSWVYAWDHVPAIVDGGLEAAQLTAQSGADGSFVFPGVDAGSYYLAVQYDLDGDGDPNGSNDRFRIDPNPQQPSLSPIVEDVQTTLCTTWSDFDTDVPRTLLLALIADVQDVSGKGELPSNQVKSVTASDPNQAGFGLTQVVNSQDPYIDGKYAWIPATGPVDAVAGRYRFDVSADGYPRGTCASDNQPLTDGPSGLSVPAIWRPTSGNSVSWTSAPGTEQDDLEAWTIDGSGNETQSGYFSNVTSPYTVPAGTCAQLSKCRIRVRSFHFDDQLPQAAAIESASTSTIFTTQ